MEAISHTEGEDKAGKEPQVEARSAREEEYTTKAMSHTKADTKVRRHRGWSGFSASFWNDWWQQAFAWPKAATDKAECVDGDGWAISHN